MINTVQRKISRSRMKDTVNVVTPAEARNANKGSLAILCLRTCSDLRFDSFLCSSNSE